MPGYRGHLAFGALFFCISLLFFPVSFVPVLSGSVKLPFLLQLAALCACLLGSLFPDVDTKSKGRSAWWKLIFSALLVAIFAFQWFAAAVVVGIGIFPVVMPHRGIFHAWWFLAGLSIAMGYGLFLLFPRYLSVIIYLAGYFFYGCLSHILCDRFVSSLKKRW